MGGCGARERERESEGLSSNQSTHSRGKGAEELGEAAASNWALLHQAVVKIEEQLRCRWFRDDGKYEGVRVF
jgi:hypothetical protein